MFDYHWRKLFNGSSESLCVFNNTLEHL